MAIVWQCWRGNIRVNWVWLRHWWGREWIMDVWGWGFSNEEYVYWFYEVLRWGWKGWRLICYRLISWWIIWGWGFFRWFWGCSYIIICIGRWFQLGHGREFIVLHMDCQLGRRLCIQDSEQDSWEVLWF